MAEYLSVAIKDEMIVKIQKHVKAKYAKSASGKELAALERKIAKKIRELWKKKYPLADMRVLKKYGFRDNLHRFTFMLDSNQKLRLHVWRNDKPVAEIKFNPPLLGPNGAKVNDNLLQGKPLQANLVAYYKIFNDHTCEIGEVVKAYASRLNRFRTVKQLISEFPDMKRFLPKSAAPLKKDESTKIIQEFEKAS